MAWWYLQDLWPRNYLLIHDLPPTAHIFCLEYPMFIVQCCAAGVRCLAFNSFHTFRPTESRRLFVEVWLLANIIDRFTTNAFRTNANFLFSIWLLCWPTCIYFGCIFQQNHPSASFRWDFISRIPSFSITICTNPEFSIRMNPYQVYNPRSSNRIGLNRISNPRIRIQNNLDHVFSRT